jgi:hypothetical protein
MGMPFQMSIVPFPFEFVITAKTTFILFEVLSGQLRWRRAAQNAIDIGGGTTKEVYRVGCVGEQTAVSGKGRIRIDRRYVVSGRARYDRRAMHVRECTRDDKAASRLVPQGDDGRFDLYVAMNGRRD